MAVKRGRTRGLDDLNVKSIKMCAHFITDTFTCIHNHTKIISPKHLNKPQLCPSTNKETTKTLQSIDISQFSRVSKASWNDIYADMLTS